LNKNYVSTILSKNYSKMNDRRMKFRKRIIFCVLVIAYLFVCSCGGGSGTSSGGAGSNSLNINITDSPFSDAKSILVTFSQVQVHSSGGGWVTVPFPGGDGTRTCDLTKLAGSQDVLGTGPIMPGHYTMIRLVVSQSTLYFDNGSTGPTCGSYIAPPTGLNAPLTIPSGDIKLNREFDLSTTRSTNILLDFNGDRSIIKTGNNNYTMNPVIGIVSVQ
jgi:hypothetical protein